MNRDLEQNMTDQPTPAEDLSTPSSVNRRRLLVGGGVAALAAALAACDQSNQGSQGGQTSGSANPAPNPNAAAEGDLAVAQLAAGLEVLAVNTYGAAQVAANAGKLGSVPSAVVQYVTTALDQHQQHLAAWNKVLTSAGKPEVTTPNATLKPTVDSELAKVKDVTGVANLALMLEQIAAQTYLKAMPTLKDKNAIRTAAQIQIVDQQHQAILLYALGMYPVPEVFQSTDKAVTS